ncbi:polysaccharide lyase [Dyadobacter luticola]|uniref:Polysaccharide lyase n=1 Tax=Dyadobacter luticola TaxID=1979387 RepID=A0A5R9L4M2_9BACT|nr:polysaccharide lyase [Dyadobacter luticola]TLV03230.1 hypothetical protein FEN17_06360 [Dyadobacter luticola]
MLRMVRKANGIALLIGLIAAINSCKNPDVEVKEPVDPDLIEADSFLLAYHSFESGLGNWFESSTCCSWSAATTTEIKRAGNHSARFELRRKDSMYEYQAQLARAPNKNKEGWFGFSLYFPSTFTPDSLEEGIVHWQSLPDFAMGEEWRSPPLLLGVLRDSLVLEIRTDPKQVTKQGDGTFTRITLGKLDKDSWLDWVFHIKWAYDETGVLEVWKNGVPIVSRLHHPNTYNDVKFPYVKIGVGKWDWATASTTISPLISERVVYIDEVTIGKENASFDKVKPGRK